MKLKFCGIRRVEDVTYCNGLLPDYMGMILSPGFRRSVDWTDAKALALQKDRRIQLVGVFVNATVAEILSLLEVVSLDVIQLHGHEDAVMIDMLRAQTDCAIWKAVRVQSAAEIAVAEQLGADALVLEGYVPGQVGGTGQTADWNLIAQARPKMPFFLAGGLRLENLEKACQQVQPGGVDLASGAETDGIKDFEKMKAIVEYIRGEKAWKK